MKSLVGVLVLGALGTVGCGEESGNNNNGPARSLTIATLIDRTGSNANPTWVSAADLAFKDMNAALKQTGFKNLQFVQAVGDSASSATVATMNATDLVKNRGAKALIGDNSLVDLALNGLNYAPNEADSLKVPVLCFACTSAAINNPNAADPATPTDPAMVQAVNAQRDKEGWNHRVSMITALQAPVMVQLHLSRGKNGDTNDDGKFKIAIYATNEPFGQSLSKAIAAAAAKLHPEPAPLVEIVWLPSTADPGTWDFAADLAKLTDDKNEQGGATDGKPDVIFNTVFLNYSIALTRSWSQASRPIPFVAGDTFRRRTAIDVLGADANGQEGTSPLVADTTEYGKTFTKEFQEATNLTPSGYDPQAYDGVLSMLLAAAVAAQPLEDASQVTPAQINEGLKKINDASGHKVGPGAADLAKALEYISKGEAINYEGGSGSCDFDANRNTLGKIVHWKVEDRKFVDYEQYDCAKGNDCPVVK
jgi:ABC-type branched-subunit amino acid transport system substrate-binding protein